MEPPFPPFVPDEDEAVPATNGQPRLRDIPLRVIFPNVLTLLAIASGLTAIRFAIENRPEMAIGAIILAAVLDGIDGRVARFLKSTSRFGAQMDSLADFVNFGVAPGMIIYFTFLGEIRTPGWIAVIVYAICACLRLARFNVQLDQPKSAPWRNDFFTGVPAPAGAMVVLLPAYLSLLGVEITGELAWLAAVFSGLVGMLMVSNLPTYSGKTLGSRIPSNIALPVIIGLVIVVALVLSYPWQVLTALALIYLASIPWSMYYFNRLAAREASGAMDEEKGA
jgi:CDP-diacylglycerol--serine O-phosphatidyltransferase